MRTINHFVIRNGKLVAKTQAQNAPDFVQSKLNILKPSSVIVRSLNQQTDPKQKDKQPSQSIMGIKNYYEAIIKNYQQRIRNLQKQLSQKNQIIQKLNKHKLQNQGASTARDSRISGLSSKQSMSDFKFKTIQNLANKTGEKQQLESSLSRVVKDAQNAIRSNQNISQIHQLQKNSSMSSIPSISEIPSEIQLQSGEGNRNIMQSGDNKTFFDTSTLMARLNKSASLVRNIKKFLQPENKQKGKEKSKQVSPYQKSSQTEQPSVLQVHRVTEQDEQVIHQQFQTSDQLGRDSEQERLQTEVYIQTQLEVQVQLQKFIDQLIVKHEQILDLMQQLTLQKDLQIKQINKYYQQAISKMQSCKQCKQSAFICKEATSNLNPANRNKLRHKYNMLLKNPMQCKQNRKSDQLILQICEKERNFKQYLSSNTSFSSSCSGKYGSHSMQLDLTSSHFNGACREVNVEIVSQLQNNQIKCKNRFEQEYNQSVDQDRQNNILDQQNCIADQHQQGQGRDYSQSNYQPYPLSQFNQYNDQIGCVQLQGLQCV